MERLVWKTPVRSKYWDGEIESTLDAIQALKPINPAM
jgi:hypothetical protein